MAGRAIYAVKREARMVMMFVRYRKLELRDAVQAARAEGFAGVRSS